MYILLAFQGLIPRRSNILVSGWIPLPQSSSPRQVSQMRQFSATSPRNPSLDGSTKDRETADASLELESLKKQHTVTWQTKSSAATPDATSTNDESANACTISFGVYHGETLRTAALRRNVVSPHNGRANLINCRGLGTCGTCAVEVLAGPVDPPERNRVEELRFNFPPHNFHNNSKLRLACQIQVRGDIQVLKRTGFWGQNEDLAAPSSPQRYFGDLEYVLDNKSPPEEPVEPEKDR